MPRCPRLSRYLSSTKSRSDRKYQIIRRSSSSARDISPHSYPPHGLSDLLCRPLVCCRVMMTPPAASTRCPSLNHHSLSVPPRPSFFTLVERAQLHLVSILPFPPLHPSPRGLLLGRCLRLLIRPKLTMPPTSTHRDTVGRKLVPEISSEEVAKVVELSARSHGLHDGSFQARHTPCHELVSPTQPPPPPPTEFRPTELTPLAFPPLAFRFTSSLTLRSANVPRYSSTWGLVPHLGRHPCQSQRPTLRPDDRPSFARLTLPSPIRPPLPFHSLHSTSGGVLLDSLTCHHRPPSLTPRQPRHSVQSPPRTLPPKRRVQARVSLDRRLQASRQELVCGPRVPHYAPRSTLAPQSPELARSRL